MKKIISLLIISVLLFSTVYWYNFTEKDKALLENIQTKIEILYEKNPSQVEKLDKVIDSYLTKLPKDSRNFMLLSSIKDIISKLDTPEESSEIIIQVLEVIDGDTFTFKHEGKIEKVRMIGIDSPENSSLRLWYSESFSQEATNFLKEKIEWEEVVFEYDDSQWKYDDYGRHLVYVFLWSENINNTMILNGYAKEYTYDKKYKYSDLFKESETRAQEKNLWLWDEKVEEKNEEIKSNFMEDVQAWECNIKWNINSKGDRIYHYPGCPSYNRTKISPSKWEKYFCSQEEARNAGWRVAWNCN